MKRSLYFFLLIIIGLAGCKSKEQVSTPEEIGLQVMEVLEKMTDITRPEFRQYFASANDLHSISKNKKLVKDEEQRRRLKKTTKRVLKVRYHFMHRRLKVLGKRHGINWNRVEFDSFTHKIEEFDGTKFCYGILKFKYKDRIFSVETTSIYDGTHYLLLGIQGLKPIVSEESI